MVAIKGRFVKKPQVCEMLKDLKQIQVDYTCKKVKKVKNVIRKQIDF